MGIVHSNAPPPVSPPVRPPPGGYDGPVHAKLWRQSVERARGYVLPGYAPAVFDEHSTRIDLIYVPPTLADLSHRD